MAVGLTGFNCVISVGGNDLTGMSNEVTLNIETTDLDEVSSFGEAWELIAGGLVSRWDLEIKGRWNGQAAEIDALLFAMVGAGIQALDHFRPEGTGSGNAEYSADDSSNLIGCYLESYNVPTPKTAAVKYSAKFRGSGELTRAQQV